MRPRTRVTLKLLWMAALVAIIVLFSQVRYDFVYQAF
jgi:hypothetical protein